MGDKFTLRGVAEETARLVPGAQGINVTQGIRQFIGYVDGALGHEWQVQVKVEAPRWWWVAFGLRHLYVKVKVQNALQRQLPVGVGVAVTVV